MELAIITTLSRVHNASDVAAGVVPGAILALLVIQDLPSDTDQGSNRLEVSAG